MLDCGIRPTLCRGVAAAAALSLAALGAVLFLDADKAQAATMLADHAGALDALVEASEELIEALPFAKFNPHAFSITPPQGVMAAGKHSTSLILR
jgi:hypothetical protein